MVNLNTSSNISNVINCYNRSNNQLYPTCPFRFGKFVPKYFMKLNSCSLLFIMDKEGESGLKKVYA
ncbi:hypothetical protein BLOT_002909 [Blomia tropicalis]|nr:hypothetical protein BLOT_002909 [Blomia tropicalis]